MSINRQGSVYTVVYIIILVVVVGTALAFTSLGLKQRQQTNIDADKMRQILAAAHIEVPKGEMVATFNACIESQPVYDIKGNVVGNDAFTVDVAAQSKLPGAERQLPLYVCRLDTGDIKYIIPLSGTGLWGPIWGYVAIDADGSTIYGAYYAHQGETPGLGAEISKSWFSSQFEGKQLLKDGRFLPVNVLKKGLKPTNGEDYVDAVSGGTITSKGVASMLSNCLEPYKAILHNLNSNQ